MSSISLIDLSVIATTPLFSDLNLTIGDNDRVGLIAGNGNGKSTLLKVIAGQQEPATGSVVRSRGLKLGFVEQDVPDSVMDTNLYDAVLAALPEGERETDSWRVDVVLDEFETPDAMRQRPVKALSGGWQRLMLIARQWVNQPDALLLDEPTNHLDLAKLFQLEEWLNRSTRGMPVVIASHDRDFLDATTNRTLFLRPGTSHYFALPYSHARQALEDADAFAEKQQERDLKEAKQLRKQAAKLTNVGINSGSDLLVLKSKQLRDRAAKIEDAQKALHKERSGEIRLANRGTHAKVLVSLDDIMVTTPSDADLFKTGKVHIFQGDRIVLLGRNGAGKSQLVKLLHKAMVVPDSVAGIKVTPSLVLGYADQDMAQLKPDQTPWETVAGFNLGDTRNRALLASAGFLIEKQQRPIRELSLGQRARLGLLVLRLTMPNFYLMDEPTNHVDIPGREKLEEEILAHEASSVLVSHDRSFVRNVGTRFLLIEGRRLKEVDGPEGFFAAMAEERG